MIKQNRASLRGILISAILVAAAVLCSFVSGRIDGGIVNHLLDFINVLIYLGLFSAWGMLVRRRVGSRTVSSYLTVISVLACAWMVVKEFKLEFVIDQNIGRWLWYSYYVFIVLIPLFAFCISISIGKNDESRMSLSFLILIIPAFALIILALTNDFHQLLFSFPGEAALWSEADYSFGPVFYVIAVWSFLCFAASYVTMTVRCRDPKGKKYFWLPLVPLVLSASYAVLYGLKVPAVNEFSVDAAVFFCLMAVLFFECCILNGYIVSDIMYADLAGSIADTEIKITDNNYNVFFSSKDRDMITADLMKRAENGPVVLPDGKRVQNMQIRGGRVIWSEDVSEFLSLSEKLEDIREALMDHNEFLRYSYEKDIDSQIIYEQNRLYDLLEKKINGQIAEISSLSEEYGKSDEKERKKILSRIVVLGTYIKIYRDFLLTLDPSKTVPESKLFDALDESFGSLKLLGIKGSSEIHTSDGQIAVDTLMFAYEFFEDVTEAFLKSMSEISVKLKELDDSLQISVFTDCIGRASDLVRKYPDVDVVTNENGSEYVMIFEGGDK